MSWTRLSHLRGSGLTPGWNTKTLSATWLECLQSWRSWPAVALLLCCTLESPASSLFCPKGCVPQRKTVALKIFTALRWLFFSFVLSQVPLAHRDLRAEASHPAPPTRFPSAEWLLPTPQLSRACAQVGRRTLGFQNLICRIFFFFKEWEFGNWWSVVGFRYLWLEGIRLSEKSKTRWWK